MFSEVLWVCFSCLVHDALFLVCRVIFDYVLVIDVQQLF
jgi:hypothetical protein